MAGNNESEINEMTNIENCNESNSMSDFEIHSTPNVSRENKIKNNSDETNITEDSGVQLTPTSTKCSKSDNDIMSFLQQQFNVINCRFDSNEITLKEMKSDFNCKLEVQNNKFDVQNHNFNDKFDELKNNIQEINKHFENTNEIIKNSLNKLEQSIELSLIHICKNIKF